jgi:acetyltransferase
MSIRNLESVFAPRSVVLIGASARARSIGATVLRNLKTAGFAGKLWLVNPKHRELDGLAVYPTIAALPDAPQLAIVCTPPETVPTLIGQLGERGTRAAIVLTGGLATSVDAHGKSLTAAMLDAAKPYLLRILGPNCVGAIVPALGLNASFAHTDALPGKTAFVSQSGALITTVLDWAKSRGIGFSKLVSLGDAADVDFGDTIDYLASDPATHAILLYIEGITSARKFMSAARAAARNKPVIALKSGRVAEGARAATTHTGALAGADDVYDAAIRRAGMLRVATMEDLFESVETLARSRPQPGDRLAIVSNGGGPAVMAVDELVQSGGRLAELSSSTVERLDAVLPATWSHANPVDIIGDAPVERYVHAVEAVAAESQVDAVLLIHAPTAVVPSADIAKALVPVARNAGRNVLGCWLGGDSAEEARRAFEQAGLPTYATPESAVNAFMQTVHYRRNQELLMQLPAAVPAARTAERDVAERVVKQALAGGRSMLSETEAKDVLAAFGIPVVATRLAADIDAAVAGAEALGYPVALKILSPDITHKSDVGGVALNLATADAIREAAQAMLRNIAKLRPDAALSGFTVQRMVKRASAYELITGISVDPTFGPIVLFGQGGTAVEVLADRAIALPPLNDVLAHDLVSRTRVSRLLAGYRDHPPANLDALCAALVSLSHLVETLPEIVELDINPLLVDDDGVLALDARIAVAHPENTDRLCIRPYPAELEEQVVWNGRAITLRPVRPEDGSLYVEFFECLTDEDVRFRKFMLVRDLPPSQIARQTQIDYDREMSFVAVGTDAEGGDELLGVAQAIADPDNVQAEFAIAVRSDLKGRHLGTLLLSKLFGHMRTRGTRRIVGAALADNHRMLALARRNGCSIALSDAGTVALELSLADSGPRDDGAQRAEPVVSA